MFQLSSLFDHHRLLKSLILTLALIPIAVAQNEEKAIHTFHGKDGVAPSAAPIRDAAGDLYGTTYAGGSHGCTGDGCGTVYELCPRPTGGWTEIVLHVFRFNGEDGVFPNARLTMDQAGNLFGTTVMGGNGCGGFGCGTVFELLANGDGTWKAKTLHSFNDADGQAAYTAVVLGSNGNIYGTTLAGGAHNAGVIYQLSPSKDGHWSATVLHDFTGGKDGQGPGQLVSDEAGNLYGPTGTGGTYDFGTVFQLSPSGGQWKKSVLYNFKPGKSALRVGSIILDNSGGFYGTLVSQQTDGAIFQLRKVNGEWKESIIFRFDLNNGSWPVSGLTLDPAGDIYGTTEFGGSHDLGLVYQLTPTNGDWKQRVLHEFAGGKDGATPWDGVVLGPKGSLYGTTRQGGTPGFGIVFHVTP